MVTLTAAVLLVPTAAFIGGVVRRRLDSSRNARLLAAVAAFDGG